MPTGIYQRTEKCFNAGRKLKCNCGVCKTCKNREKQRRKRKNRLENDSRKLGPELSDDLFGVDEKGEAFYKGKK